MKVINDANDSSNLLEHHDLRVKEDVLKTKTFFNLKSMSVNDYSIKGNPYKSIIVEGVY
jgi:hypothetical protein